MEDSVQRAQIIGQHSLSNHVLTLREIVYHALSLWLMIMFHTWE